MNALLACLYLSLQTTYLLPRDNPMSVDRQQVVNPYARVAIGCEGTKQLGPVLITGFSETYHMSSTATRYDLGDDGITLGLKVKLVKSQ